MEISGTVGGVSPRIGNRLKRERERECVKTLEEEILDKGQVEEFV